MRQSSALLLALVVRVWPGGAVAFRHEPQLSTGVIVSGAVHNRGDLGDQSTTSYFKTDGVF